MGVSVGGLRHFELFLKIFMVLRSFSTFKGKNKGLSKDFFYHVHLFMAQ